MKTILMLLLLLTSSKNRYQENKKRKGNVMIFFNAFQLTVLFAAWPFIINWLSTASFSAHGVLYWVAMVAYIIHFGFNVFATGYTLDKS